MGSAECRRDRAPLTMPWIWTPNQALKQSEDDDGDDDENEDEHLPLPGVTLSRARAVDRPRRTCEHTRQ